MTRAVRSSEEPFSCSRRSRSSGCSGVRFSNRILFLASSGAWKLMVSDLEQREIALGLLGRADLAGDGVAGPQVEAADLAGRHVDVVRARHVGAVGGAQETEAVLQDLHHALAGDVLAFLGLGLQQWRKMMSCFLARDMFSMPWDSAIATSSAAVFCFNSVRFIGCCSNVDRCGMARQPDRLLRVSEGGRVRRQGARLWNIGEPERSGKRYRKGRQGWGMSGRPETAGPALRGAGRGTRSIGICSARRPWSPRHRRP
jgi:hypothetical protein